MTNTLDPRRLLTAEAEATVETLPRGRGGVLSDVRKYTTPDPYDPGPHPAEVGGEVGFVSSYNYQSLRLTVRVVLPSRPEDVPGRAETAFAFAHSILNRQAEHLKTLAEALGMPPSIPTSTPANERGTST